MRALLLAGGQMTTAMAHKMLRAGRKKVFHSFQHTLFTFDMLRAARWRNNRVDCGNLLGYVSAIMSISDIHGDIVMDTGCFPTLTASFRAS